MKIKHLLLGLATAACVAAPAFAMPIQFSIDAIKITPDKGYGTGSEELLDVVFLAANAPGIFNLDLGGSKTRSFDVGSVTLREDCINPGGCPKPPAGNAGQETDFLNVTVTFHFVDPLTGNQNLTLVGTAIPGMVNDGNNEPKEDYALKFTTQEFAFGNGGKFSILLNDLSFTSKTTQTLQATVTLLNAPSDSQVVGNVPEPGSLALIGLGLAGLGFSARRRKA